MVGTGPLARTAKKVQGPGRDGSVAVHPWRRFDGLVISLFASGASCQRNSYHFTRRSLLAFRHIKGA